MAPYLFQHIRAHRLLLEYDDDRSGAFAALRHIPEDKWAVLGLVSTKRSRLERRQDLEDKLRDASRYIPRERLALSPQCGFSTSILGNRLAPDDQKHKLQLVIDTVNDFWGASR